jgi:diguanylate cyclase (GGDEF)-like protein
MDGIQRLPDGVCLVDRGGRIISADPVLSEKLAAAVNCGAPAGQLAALFEGPDALQRLERVFQGEPEQNFATKLAWAAPIGAVIAVRMRLLVGAEPLALVEYHREAAASAPVRLDPLTQLPDREAIAPRIEQWRHDAAPQEARFAVLFLDLDGFKRVNDDYGHAVGDQVLQTLATRWVGCVREGDLVARYGGDEFVALVQNASTPEEIDPIVRRLRMATEEPVIVDSRTHQASVTIGVAVATTNASAVDALLAAADRDMYSRKRAERA